MGAGIAPRGLSGVFGFDGRHVRAEAWVQQHGARLIQGISDESAEVIRKVIVTGLEDDTAMRRAFQAGATDFITKPLAPLVLQNRIRFRLMRMHRQKIFCPSPSALLLNLPVTLYTPDDEAELPRHRLFRAAKQRLPRIWLTRS